MAATGIDTENARATAPTHPDERRSRLRTILAAHVRELDALDGDGGGGAHVAALRTTWAQLTSELNLGPEPEVRSCPVCNALGMRDATRCLECWSRLRQPD